MDTVQKRRYVESTLLTPEYSPHRAQLNPPRQRGYEMRTVMIWSGESTSWIVIHPWWRILTRDWGIWKDPKETSIQIQEADCQWHLHSEPVIQTNISLEKKLSKYNTSLWKEELFIEYFIFHMFIDVLVFLFHSPRKLWFTINNSITIGMVVFA